MSRSALRGAGAGRCFDHEREGLEVVVVLSEWRRGLGWVVCVLIGYWQVRARV